MTTNIRKAVRVLLLNEKKELLLMCVENFDIATPSGKKNQRFWCTIGGGIEVGESIEHAALREIFEETGLEKKSLDLGPIVWHGYVDLILKGILTRLDETFIVAKTKNNHVSLHNPTPDEKQVVTKLKWFSLEDIKKSKEAIFPIILPQYLPDIIAERYPSTILEIDLAKQPN